jgi:predicted ABC-type ATPase
LLQSYLSIADTALIVDNSLDEGGRLIARKNLGNSLEIHNKTVWEEMQKVAHG